MTQFDIIIIGAGPAGCSAARMLAQAGWRVGLFDKAHFPREKTCGDALIPDAHKALDKLQLRERVERIAYSTQGLRLISFDGSEVSVRGHTAVTPRIKLDALLLEAAQEAGAQFLPGHDFQAIQDEDGAIYRVDFSTSGGKTEVRSPWVLLATGANAAPIARAGMLERHEASSFSVRQYVRNPRMARDFNELVFILDHAVRDGYGWIFPGPDGVFNIGIIEYTDSTEKNNNLRHKYDQFIKNQPLAKDLMSDGEVLTLLKGAPLRAGLSGARFAEGGLLAIGECIGTTLPLTSEGIGKAMETGILAAESLLANSYQGRAAVAAAYTAQMIALKPKFDAYRKPEILLRWPWLVNFLVHRAGKNEYLRTRLEALFNEKANPANLFRLKKWLRILFG